MNETLMAHVDSFLCVPKKVLLSGLRVYVTWYTVKDLLECLNVKIIASTLTDSLFNFQGVHRSFGKNRLESHIENISDKYMDDLLRDFSSNFQTSSPLRSSKHGIHTLSDSIISQINIMLTILKEEQIPELVESLQDRHIVPDDEDFVRPFAQINDENLENEAASPPQPSLHGDSGCVACAFAPFNGDALLTIHCPTTVSLSVFFLIYYHNFRSMLWTR